jgi:hypothetical protein
MGLETTLEKNQDIIDIIVPFSDVSSQKNEEYIYNGEEKIPFPERHPIFQALMLYEFVEFKSKN